MFMSRQYVRRNGQRCMSHRMYDHRFSRPLDGISVYRHIGTVHGMVLVCMHDHFFVPSTFACGDAFPEYSCTAVLNPHMYSTGP